MSDRTIAPRAWRIDTAHMGRENRAVTGAEISLVHGFPLQ